MQFKLNNDMCGGSLQGHVKLIPSKIAKRFGSDFVESGDGKASRNYTFEGPGEIVFTLYDWKMTSLYDDDAMTPETLWKLNNPVTFNIGGWSEDADKLDDFITWIKKELNKGEK